MRVAVTGAAGFIGGAVCRRLVADGDEPIGVDLEGAERRADIADPVATVAALGGADAVIHTAALVSERGRMADFVRINTRGTRNVLDRLWRRPGRDHVHVPPRHLSEHARARGARLGAAPHARAGHGQDAP